MTKTKFLAAASAAALLTSCGGDSGGAPPTGGTPTPPTSTLNVSLSASNADVTVPEGGQAKFGFVASYSGTSSAPVVADIVIGGRRYTLDGEPSESGKQFTVDLATVPFPAGGETSSTVTFRLCTSSACSTVYPGSTKTFTVNLDVEVGDWMTLQRNAAHTGYVAVRYDPDDFSDAWTMTDFSSMGINVAATRGSIFSSLVTNSGTYETRAISSTDGNEQWAYDLTPAGYLSAPYFADGRLASMAMDSSSGNVPMQVLDKDGRYQTTITYASQFSPGGTPTPFAGKVYFQAGYYGNVVYAADPVTGGREWVTDTSVGARGYVHEGQSVGVDDDFVYYFGGGDLVLLARDTGTEAKRIANPFFSGFGNSYHGSYLGAPILDGQGRVFTFTDNKWQNQPLPLMAWSTDTDTALWRTNASYINHPAYREGLLYAPRANSAVVDVIDTADGSVVRSIQMNPGSSNLTSNVVLTERHLFVATSTTTYAIDIGQTGNPVVWSTDKGGELAITPDNILVISSNNGIHGIKLF